MILMLLLASALMGASGLPALMLSARAPAGQRLTTLFLVVGALLGLGAVAAILTGGQSPSLNVAWGLPHSRFAVAADPLSCLFLLPVFLIPMLGAVYGHGYWRPAERVAIGRRVGVACGLLAGAMALVVMARDCLLFLVAWEIMAMAAFFAATAEDDKPEVRAAGWIYLVATHVGTLCLFAMFACWRQATGGFLLEPGTDIAPAAAGAIFLLALVGFGCKAGLMPLHVWLPGAHANAPSHVSAVLSGVMLKMGIYGLARMTALLPDGPLWWGGVLLAAGAFSSVSGIAFAIGQHDLKRMLAYSSIENVGIMAMGLGLALIGRSADRPVWVALGLGGALFHALNHSLFKPLLFFCAGAVIHATGTREIDRLGGLARLLPKTMALFAVGAVAICALPPLNGFAGEWLLYLGLFRTLEPGGLPAVAPAAAALAMTGALAVACFVKAFGTVFLGEARTALAAQAHEPPATMLAPMFILAGLCAVLGLVPVLAAPVLDAAIRGWAPSVGAGSLAAAAPLGRLTPPGLGLVLLIAAVAGLCRWTLRGRSVRHGPTWDCGYACPTARMQYTGSSLGDSPVKLLSFVLRPKTLRPVTRALFPRPSGFRLRVPDVVLDRLALPLCRAVARRLPRLRVLQQGQTPIYILYILIAVVLLLVWGSLGR